MSYKRNTALDEPLVREVVKALEQRGNDAFIDLELRPGDNWASDLENHIRTSDFLIVFLSEQAIRSEMVRGEIEIARDQAAKSGGKPKIIPVRLAFAGTLPYPLNSYLDSIQYAIWNCAADTPRLIAELAGCVSGSPIPAAPQLPETSRDLYPSYSAHLPPPGGTLDVDDPWYIARDCDVRALARIRQRGQTITIKGPRQMGKSSLLMRIVATAIEAGKRCALLDLQLLDESTRQSQDLCLRRFAEWIAEELDIPDRAAQFWDPDTPHPKNCSRYLEKHVLARIETPVTLAIDEADILFSTSFRADFFAMLRTWHNDRSNPMKAAWKKLDIVLVTSTEPYMFINRVEQSPFNVGEVLALEDFSPAQVRALNARHKSPLPTGEVDRLIGLLDGHPYLLRKALYSVAGDDPSHSCDELFRRAADDDGPFGDHLRHYLLRLQEMPDLLQSLAGIAAGRDSNTGESQYYRLQSAGLAKRVQGKIVPRCKLYGDYFRERLRTRS